MLDFLSQSGFFFSCVLICSHILKVPFENSGGSGIVYIWIGSQATQEEAIHAEQMGRGMFEVGGASSCHGTNYVMFTLLL